MTKVARKGMRGLIVVGTLLLSFSAAFGQDAISAPAAQPVADPGSEQYIELLRKDIRSMKKQVVAANLELTDKEAEKFWPLYDQYATELAKINDTKVALIKAYAENYSTMTDEQAEQYVKGRAAVDRSVDQLRVKYFPVFRRILSVKTTALFFQIDWRLSQMIDLQIAAQTPLIQP